MPIYEYRCERSHVTEQIRALQDRSVERPCPKCGAKTVLAPSISSFRGLHPTVIDSAKEAWWGTPLADSDGVNELHYKSNKLQVDLGK